MDMIYVGKINGQRLDQMKNMLVVVSVIIVSLLSLTGQIQLSLAAAVSMVTA